MSKSETLLKFAVIGNAGGGKTTLSRRLAEIYKIPLTHIDSIQFVAGMNIRPMSETRQILQLISKQPQWLIDGFGPLDLIEARFQEADCIVFIDLPVLRHYWWSAKRQIKSFWSTRQELPAGCNEASFGHTIKLFKTIYRVHKKMRPELLKILQRDKLAFKTIHIQNLKDWNDVYHHGIFKN